MTKDEHAEMIRKMRELKIPAFLDAYLEQQAHEPSYISMPFADRLLMLISAESDSRLENRTARLAKHAGLPIPQARFSDLDHSPERSLNFKTLNTLRNNDYVRQAHNVIITGAAGSGKTYISSCRSQTTVGYGVHAISECLGRYDVAASQHTFER